MNSLLLTMTLLVPLASTVTAGADEPQVLAEPAVDIGVRPAADRRPERAGKPTGFRLRCWQHGRLLFEEIVQQPPDGAQVRARMKLADVDQGTVMLLELSGALCSVRPDAAPAHKHP
jgi:hypothetical protein